GVTVSELLPANCGFLVSWSEHLRQRFAGAPLKPVIATVTTTRGERIQRRGEAILSEDGLEGSLIYALAAPLRELIARDGQAQLQLDLAPDRSQEQLAMLLAQPRKGPSLSSILLTRAGVDPLTVAPTNERLVHAHIV